MAKTNIFAFVYYTESISDVEMLSRLRSEHFKAVLSPLHCDDVYERDDVLKLCKSKAEEHANHVTWLYDDGSEVPFGSLDSIKETPESMLWYDYSRGNGTKRKKHWDCPRVGEHKKEHRHVMIKLDYSTTRDTLLNMFTFRKSNIAYFETVRSRDAYVRYLCHLDEDSKPHYKREDVISLGGFDLSPLYQYDDAKRESEFALVYKLIDEDKTATLSSVIDKLMRDDNQHLAYVVRGSAAFWTQYLKDRNFVPSRKEPINWDIGELLDKAGLSVTPDGEIVSSE